MKTQISENVDIKELIFSSAVIVAVFAAMGLQASKAMAQASAKVPSRNAREAIRQGEFTGGVQRLAEQCERQSGGLGYYEDLRDFKVALLRAKVQAKYSDAAVRHLPYDRESFGDGSLTLPKSEVKNLGRPVRLTIPKSRLALAFLVAASEPKLDGVSDQDLKQLIADFAIGREFAFSDYTGLGRTYRWRDFSDNWMSFEYLRGTSALEISEVFFVRLKGLYDRLPEIDLVAAETSCTDLARREEEAARARTPQ
jgi:hypothetical protein